MYRIGPLCFVENCFLFWILLLIDNGAQYDVKDNQGNSPLDISDNEDVKKFLTEKKSENTTTEETVSNKDPCIICHGPRNGFYVLLPCGHASLCEKCCKTITNQKFAKCPTCRRPAKSYTKIFFQVWLLFTINYKQHFNILR